MTEGSELAEAQSEALQKIGRNVLNFQRMEAMLKYLVARNEISGPVSGLEAIRKRSIGAAAKKPMGQLAESFIRSLYVARSGCNGDPASDQTAASFSFSLEGDDEYKKERKKALRHIVASRNKLIHQWLADFDPRSIQSCNDLSRKLDEQREMIREEFEVLRSIILAIAEFGREFDKYIQPGEFDAALGKVLHGA